MPTEVGTPVSVDSWSVPLDGVDGYVRMRHERWPSFCFVVAFNADAAVTGFSVEREPDGPALTAKSLQRVPYGALERTALDLASTWTAAYAKGRSPDLDASEYLDGLGSGVHRLARAFAETQYTGRRGRSLVEYAAVAARYAALVAAGSRSPIKDLANQLKSETGEYLSDARVRNIIFECRERCLLSAPPKAGVAGGHLTKKAKGLLGQSAEREEN